MRYIYFILISVILFTSCTHKSVEVPEKAPDNDIPFIFPRNNMVYLLDSFIQEVKPIDKFNEIYIDRRYLQDFDLIIFSGKSSLSESAIPLGRVKYKEVIFDIYSGAEHYFSNTPIDTAQINDSPNSENSPKGTYWVIEDRNGEYNIKKDFWALPFYTLIGSGINFTPPSQTFENK